MEEPPGGWPPKKLVDATGVDTVNENETLVHILGSHRDSTSIVSHVTEVSPQFAESLLECADITGYVGLGYPNEEAKKIVRLRFDLPAAIRKLHPQLLC